MAEQKLQPRHSTPAYAVTAGTSTAYTATIANLTLQTGQSVSIKPHTNCGASPTLNINGLGAKSLKKDDGTALASGDIKSTGVYTFVYDGTDFFFRSVGVNVSNILLNNVAVGQFDEGGTGTNKNIFKIFENSTNMYFLVNKYITGPVTASIVVFKVDKTTKTVSTYSVGSVGGNTNYTIGLCYQEGVGNLEKLHINTTNGCVDYSLRDDTFTFVGGTVSTGTLVTNTLLYNSFNYAAGPLFRYGPIAGSYYIQMQTTVS